MADGLSCEVTEGREVDGMPLELLLTIDVSLTLEDVVLVPPPFN